MVSDTLEIFNTLVLSITVSSAFLIGAILSIFIHYPERIRADLAAFSAGIFFATIAFSLIDESLNSGKVSNANTMACSSITPVMI